MRQLGFFCLLRGVKRYPDTLFTGWSCLAPHQGRWPRLGRVLWLLLEARLLSGCLKGLICSLAPVSRAVLEFGTASFKSGTGLTLASCVCACALAPTLMRHLLGCGPCRLPPAACFWAAGAPPASTRGLNHCLLFSSSLIFTHSNSHYLAHSKFMESGFGLSCWSVRSFSVHFDTFE